MDIVVDPRVGRVIANRVQVQQVIINLVRNAVEAAAERPDNGEVSVTGRVEGPVYCITVEDNGPGVPKSMQETMFYPLVTGRAEGTGLGLYLSQNLIHRNNGAISCSSRAGATIFSIIFPLERVSDE